jgi:hypothetical protein
LLVIWELGCRVTLGKEASDERDNDRIRGYRIVVGTELTIAWQIILIGVEIKELIFLLPLATSGRGHIIATLPSCQAVHTTGRQRVIVRL